MDETRLRELLACAVTTEPEMGPVAMNSFRTGLKLRRRRRIQGSVASMAATAAIGAAVLAVTAAASNPAAQARRLPETAYVLSFDGHHGFVTPISVATNRPGKPIPVGRFSDRMALTPNDKTLYVVDTYSSSVTPISTATNTAEKSIKVGFDPFDILIAPDGRTAYVSSQGMVTPIATATNRAERPIKVGTQPHLPVIGMAITPDGKTLYVGSGDYVIPISTATDRPGKRILFGAFVSQLLVTPDGKTVYALGAADGVIKPIATATGRPGKALNLAVLSAMAMTPDGKTIYVLSGDLTQRVIAIRTATNTPGKPIVTVGIGLDIAVTPDGKTVYASGQPPGSRGRCLGPGHVTPISTASNEPGRLVKVACFPQVLATSPDSKTVFVIGGQGGTVTPIATATNTPGRPISITGAEAILVAP